MGIHEFLNTHKVSERNYSIAILMPTERRNIFCKHQSSRKSCIQRTCFVAICVATSTQLMRILQGRDALSQYLY